MYYMYKNIKLRQDQLSKIFLVSFIQSEEEDDDVVDSDFDLSEKDEPGTEDREEDLQPKPKKKKWIKPYKSLFDCCSKYRLNLIDVHVYV